MLAPGQLPGLILLGSNSSGLFIDTRLEWTVFISIEIFVDGLPLIFGVAVLFESIEHVLLKIILLRGQLEYLFGSSVELRLISIKLCLVF